MRVIDNLIAIRILWLLVTPFEKTKAFQLGLIDAEGNRIKKSKTTEESNATSMLHRLAWRIKKFINLVPGGSTKIGSIVAAYALVRENMEKDEYLPSQQLLEHCYQDMGPYYDNSQEFVSLIECLLEDAPANAAGSGVSTDTVAIKKVKKFNGASQKTIDSLKNGKTSSRRIAPYLNLQESEVDWHILEYMHEAKTGVLILNDSKIVSFERKKIENPSPKQVLENYIAEWQLEVVDID